VLLIACFARHREPRRWVRWLATAVLGAVIFQGVLGGLRVVLVKLDLAIIHACVAQAFFCLAAITALVTSRWWTAAPDLSESPDGLMGRRLAYLGAATVGVIYLQLVAGALMRHFDAGLAIPDFPLAYGKILPPVSQAAMDAINHHRTFDLGLDRVTLAQVWMHFAHRLGAVAVSVLALTLTIGVFRRHRRGGLLAPAIALLLLLLAQVTLGALTVLMRKPADVASAHVAVGALVLMTSFVLTARAFRLYQPGRQAVRTAGCDTGVPPVLNAPEFELRRFSMPSAHCTGGTPVSRPS
jgi:cytochrome c oxidase assembly protein subunit 15